MIAACRSRHAPVVIGGWPRAWRAIGCPSDLLARIIAVVALRVGGFVAHPLGPERPGYYDP